MNRIYFDHNATSPLRPAARAAMIAALDAGNASSVHAEGRAARAKIENARALLARHFQVKPEWIVFTSGATEAANMVLRPGLAGETCDRLLIGAGEHPCVLSGHGFVAHAVEKIALDSGGQLDLDDLGEKLGRPGRVMLALQAANNETGAIQPVAEAAALVHEAGGMLVCDAVQAFGRLDCSFAGSSGAQGSGAQGSGFQGLGAQSLGADVLFISSHKIGGPKGVGAAIFARRAVMPQTPWIRGGGQERGHRGGTENVAAIAGFAAAVAEVLAHGGDEMERVAVQRDRIEAGVHIVAPEAVIFAGGAPRLANTLSFALPGLSAETLVAAFDVEGVALSAGSACSSGKVATSTVLAAMGVAPDLARCALRISLGWSNFGQEGVAFLEKLARLRQRIRNRA